jgi:hypothetical protein
MVLAIFPAAAIQARRDSSLGHALRSLPQVLPVTSRIPRRDAKQALHLRLQRKYRGPDVVRRDWPLRKGPPMGRFERGSTTPG